MRIPPPPCLLPLLPLGVELGVCAMVMTVGHAVPASGATAVVAAAVGVTATSAKSCAP